MNQIVQTVRASEHARSEVSANDAANGAVTELRPIQSPSDSARTERRPFLSPDARNVLVVIASSIVLTVVAGAWMLLRVETWHRRLHLRDSSNPLLAVNVLVSLYWLVWKYDIGRSLHARLLIRRAGRRYAGTPLTTIASVPDGVARIRGVGQLLTPTITSGGILALAFRTKEVRTVGGQICVGDGSGLNAVINTEWIEIARGITFENELIIPDGATIEVRGQARRVAVPEASTGGFRRVPEVLEFIGTKESPVVIGAVEPGKTD